MYLAPFRFNSLWIMKAITGLLLAISLFTTHTSAQVLVQNPYITGFQGWESTFVPGSPQINEPPRWGVLATPNPIPGDGFGKRFLIETSDGAESNGTGTNGDFIPYVLINTIDVTPSAYDLTYELASLDDDGFGVVFGYQDNDNYFRASFRQQNDTLGFPRGTSVQRVSNGVITQLGTSIAFVPTSIGTPFDVRVSVNGPVWSVEVDDRSGSGYAPILNGSNSELENGHLYGVHAWRNATVSANNPTYGTVVGPITYTPSVGAPKTTDFADLAPPVAWRRLTMVNNLGEDGITFPVVNPPVLQRIGNFVHDFVDGTIRDDSNGNFNASSDNTDFLGSAIVVDDPGSAAMTNYRFTTRVENRDNDGIGVLFRVQDDGNFYRINWATEGPGTGTTRPLHGMSIQKFSGGFWTKIPLDGISTYNDTQFLPGEKVPFDLSVQVVNDTFKIDVLSDPGGPNEQAYSYAPIQDFFGIAQGSVGFTNWGNGGTVGGAIYSSFGGDENAALVTAIDAFVSFSLTVDRTAGVATFKNENATSVNIADVSIRSNDGNLIADPGASISGTFAPGQMVNLGDIWTESRLETAVLEVILAGGEKHFAPVIFTGGPNDAAYERSDLNTDGMITVADWSLFFPNMLTDLSGMTLVEQVLAGDLDLDGDNDVNDFVLFKADYETANGFGSFDSMFVGVPEPSTYVLLLIGAVGACAIRLRRSCKAGVAAVCLLALALVTNDVRADVLAARVNVTSATVATVLQQTPGPQLFVAQAPGTTGNTGDLSLLVGASVATGVPLPQSHGVIIANPNQFQYASVNNRNIIETPGEITEPTVAGASFPAGMWLSTTRINNSDTNSAGAETNFRFSMTHFSYADGWTAGQVDANGAFYSGNTTNVTVNHVAAGNYTLSINGVNSNTDGMLFVQGTRNDTNGNSMGTGILPDGSGWDVRIVDQNGNFPGTEQDPWSFVYVPYDSLNLVAAGNVGLAPRTNSSAAPTGIDVFSQTGTFTTHFVDLGTNAGTAGIVPPGTPDGNNDQGRVLIKIPGKSDVTGMFMVGVSKYATAGGVSGADDNILAWEYNASLEGFLVESYDLAGGTLQNSDFYFAYFDYDNPILLPTPRLTLEVDRSDGTMTLKNTYEVDIEFDYYQIDSESGSLNKDGWVSLSDQNFQAIGGGVGESFDEAGGSSNSSLAEVFLLTQTQFPKLVSETEVGLGMAYNNLMNSEDLVFRYRASDGNIIVGLIDYIGVAPSQGVPGDYNDDGVVDAADYVVWRDNLNKPNANLPNDATGATVDQSDWQVWKQNFGLTDSGSGNGANVGVPEPSSVVLFCGLALLFSARRLGRRFV